MEGGGGSARVGLKRKCVAHTMWERDSTYDCRSGEPERTGEGKVLALSVPVRDAKRLSERISLYTDERSGRMLLPGDLGESLRLDIRDVLWTSGKDGVNPFPIEESRDIVRVW